MDLTSVSRELRYPYRLFQRPQGFVEQNPAICSGQRVFRGPHWKQTPRHTCLVLLQVDEGDIRNPTDLDRAFAAGPSRG